MFKEFLNGLCNFFVSPNPLGVAESRRVDDGQRKWNAESFPVMDVVGCDSLGLTVGLIFVDFLVNEFVTEIKDRPIRHPERS